jgi:hypothetical protein
MKGKYAKTSHGASRQDDGRLGSVVRVAGEYRVCSCGVVVKKGIMYEYADSLFCSRGCVESIVSSQ